jgi:TolB protein
MARLRLACLLIALLACSPSEQLPSLLVQGDGLVATDGEGTVIELLAADSETAVSQASWAPDATYAVWTEVGTESARIAMGNADSQRRIDGDTIPFFYGFSPDAKTLAYLGNDPAGRGVALGLLDINSGGARLVAAGQPFYFDWSPDSSRMVVHANQADTYLLSVDGDIQTIDVAAGTYQAPAFLDDERLLVVEGGSLVALEIATGDREALAEVETFSQFTAAAGRIAYTANAQFAPGPLFVIDDGNRVEITDEPVIVFEWSPDGTKLSYMALRREGLLPGIWNGEQSVTFPPVLPSTVFLQNYLPFWDQYSRFHTLWRADSSGFYFPRDNGEIIFFPVGGGESTVVAEGNMALPAPG